MEHRPSRDLPSEAHIGLINRWRHECEAEHESCQKTPYDQLLPSRILELLDPSDNEKGVRLIETGRKIRGTYACLSYCWGTLKTQIGQTTRKNLPGYLQYIPFNELPPTVIDTIILCFRLGFRFLWVDRLCIVQDDPKDWLEEASRMCEVYSRSALTIAVPICKDSSQSFLLKRHRVFRETLTWHKEHPKPIHIIKHRGEGSKPSGSVWIHEYNLDIQRSGPWFLEDNWREFRGRENNPRNSWIERAWTFQEWMLSPRVLHIHNMTLWDCFGGYANELNQRYMGKPILIRNPDEIEKGSGLTWLKLVEEFLRRKITRVEDRLPAMAGLAARHAQATGDTYLAGLWRKNLHWWLLWVPVRQDDRRIQFAPNRHAPSWSWASSDGEVEFREPQFMFETDASFVSTFCQYDPPGSFSRVKKAWIDIECGYSPVTEQMDGSALVKAADCWWWAEPDYESESLQVLIGDGKIYILHLQQDLEANTALLLQEHGWEDGLQCFQRIGLATLKEHFDPDPWDLPVREGQPVHGDIRQIIRLV